MNSPGRPVLKPVLLFTGLYLALAVCGAVVRGNREFILYIGVMLVVIPAIGFVHRRYPLNEGLLWAFSIWGLMHMAGGLMPIPDAWSREGSHAVLYNWWLIPKRFKFDQLTHICGITITTWLVWHLLNYSLRSPGGAPVRPTPGILTLCVAAGMGFGAFNEVVEFTATRLFADTNVGGYVNTGWDLVANFAGALIAVLFIRWGKPAQQ